MLIRSRGMLLTLVAGIIVLVVLTADITPAQVTTAVTSSGLNTTVTPNGTVQEITGGTRPGNGPNLFHSFGQFSIKAADTALFKALPGEPATTNILGRVTGGLTSQIYGTIDTITYYPGANLFLMNPAGMMFGPGATLNVGGSVSFTTGDYIRLFDGANSANFYSDPIRDGLATSVLSTAPLVNFGFLTPAAFGFLNPPGPTATITVEGSTLLVPVGQSLNLVGGAITIQSDPGTGTPASLLAPAGEINLASVASAGEVLLSSWQSGPNTNGATFTTMGPVSITEFSTLDVSDNAFEADGRGGTVRIRGGQLVVDSSFVFASTFGDVDGASTAVSLDMTGDVSLVNGSLIGIFSGGEGRPGDVAITGQNVTLDGFTFIFTQNMNAPVPGGNVTVTSQNLNFTSSSGIITDSIGSGKGGTVTIDSPTVQLTGASAILTESLGDGNGGDIFITSLNQLALSGADEFGNPSSVKTTASAAGNSGTVSIIAGSVILQDLGEIQTSSLATGNAGNMTFDVSGNLSVRGGGRISSNGSSGAGGNILVNADTVTISGQSGESRSRLETIEGAPTGGIEINTRQLQLTDNARINSETNVGQPGTVKITATESVTISNRAKVRMNTSSVGGGLMEITSPTLIMDQGILQTRTISAGDAAPLNLTAGTLTLTGSQVNSETTQITGKGGNVTLTVTGPVSITGQFAGSATDPAGPAGIFTSTKGNGGDAGSVSLTANQVALGGGARIDSSTSSPGKGGPITVTAANGVTLTGPSTGLFSETTAGGEGGAITVTGSQVQMLNNATISASGSGPGNSGKITVNAGTSLRMVDSTIKTKSLIASGGDIDVFATESVHLTNSQINTSVAGGTATVGGNITIDPNFVILQNSQILAQAFAGTGGNITIVAGTFLADPNSTVNASSERGISGTVDIRSPVTNLSETLAQLPDTGIQVAALLGERCAANVSSHFSSLVQAGNEGLPQTPGGWLPSALALAGTEGTSTGKALGGQDRGITLSSNPLGADSFQLRAGQPYGPLARSLRLGDRTSCGS